MVGRLIRIGILALQGNVIQHSNILTQLDDVIALPVRTPEAIKDLDGLIIPGGESTAMGKLMVRWGIAEAIQEQAQQGLGVFGTCAGMILLAKNIEGSDQFRLGLMNITVRRNAFGRQLDSFETTLNIPAINEPMLHTIFIRAPIITQAAPQVDILASVPQGIVLAQQGRHLSAAFHPEQLGELRLHQYFIQQLQKN